MSQAELRHHLGTVLKEARSKAGVSIEAVAYETKISKQFIVYLESGLLENLPGRVFGRGFIKNIARYLRSDSQELLQLYEECWGEGRKATMTAPTQTASVAEGSAEDVVESTANAVVSDRVEKVVEQHKRVSDIPDIKELPSVKSKSGVKIHVPGWLMRGVMTQNTLLTVLATIAAIMVVGVFGRWVVAHWNRAAVTSPVAMVSEKVVPVSTQDASGAESNEYSNTAALSAESDPMIPANVVEKVMDPSSTRVDTNSASQSAKEAAATASVAPAVAAASLPSSIADEESPLSVTGTPVAFEQLIELKVNAPVDIKVSLDGKKSERTTYAVGVTQLTFRDRVELMIQDASAVEVSFNGKSLGILGNKGRKRRVFFQAKPSESDFPH